MEERNAQEVVIVGLRDAFHYTYGLDNITFMVDERNAREDRSLWSEAAQVFFLQHRRLADREAHIVLLEYGHEQRVWWVCGALKDPQDDWKDMGAAEVKKEGIVLGMPSTSTRVEPSSLWHKDSFFRWRLCSE